MSLLFIQTNLLKLGQKLKMIPADLIPLSHIDHHIPIEKQLDEYRELINEIEKQTHFFTDGRSPWSKDHAYTLDKYLQTRCQCKKRSRRTVDFHKIRPRPTAIQRHSIS